MNNTAPLSANQLMERIKNDDEKAFHLLFNRYWEVLFVLAKSILNDEAIAKDLVQEVWINFWERRKKIESTNIEAYLKQAIKFSVYKELRNSVLSNEHKEYLQEIAAETATDDHLIYSQTNNTLTNTIHELPDRCREIFQLSREENLSNQEIANQLNISKRTVETHISHALKSLRMRLTSFLFGIML
ncbi:RNA polymerase sigma-70 factor [Galbibacter orientalis]|uniref:RNA polymerase sigma-70 factor n=1 Tax=Galbibacter orientalis TaxID=453852 RepID=UPI00307FE2EA